MSTIGEMAAIVRDVKIIEKPDLPATFWEAEDDNFRAVFNVGDPIALRRLAVIADRMYSLLPQEDQDERVRRVVVDSYCAWMVAASALDDMIDQPHITADQKMDYLHLGQEAVFGRYTPNGGINNHVLRLSFQLFNHSGELVERHAKSDNGRAVFGNSMTELTTALVRQDYTKDDDTQAEIAEVVGGVSIASPVLIAEALDGRSYDQAREAAMALGGLAQKLDNLRDVHIDDATDQLTTPVLKFREGQSTGKIYWDSIVEARSVFKETTAHLSGKQKQVINAMAHLVMIQNMLILPLRSMLKYGSLFTPVEIPDIGQA